MSSDGWHSHGSAPSYPLPSLAAAASQLAVAPPPLDRPLGHERDGWARSQRAQAAPTCRLLDVGTPTRPPLRRPLFGWHLRAASRSPAASDVVDKPTSQYYCTRIQDTVQRSCPEPSSRHGLGLALSLIRLKFPFPRRYRSLTKDLQIRIFDFHHLKLVIASACSIVGDLHSPFQTLLTIVICCQINKAKAPSHARPHIHGRFC
ncbi:hypothetical protein CVT26_012349 [Gymnopilus dilepis]|uniref:Uncharacterized protein n=1 Tax=Gymnopilus dilepis TaxID=231916 RepID=A0A409YQ28_9AGAR|nr:hypothetical protein CVT26_012349 [Gymnopilus dilepis]